MTSRRIAITGATGGIGAELALLHAARGDNLVLINRSADRTRLLEEQIRSEHPQRAVEIIEADLSDREAVRVAAEHVARNPVDLFYNNAGVLLNDKVMSKHQTEMHAEVNALAPYQFGRIVAPSMDGGTFVLVSTGAIKQSGFSVDQLSDPDAYGRLFPRPYGHSKLAATMAMAAFAQDYASVEFRSYAPGPTKTGMSSAIPFVLKPLLVFFGGADKAARQLYEAATRPGVPSGSYQQGGKVVPLPKVAHEPAVKQQLMAWFEEATGV